MYKFDYKNKFKYTVDSDGEYHSFNDQPAIEYFDNTKIWMKNGVISRNQYLGPAFRSTIKMEYYTNGKLHCDYGPAVIEILDKTASGTHCIYYVDGVYKNEENIYNLDVAKLFGYHDLNTDQSDQYANSVENHYRIIGFCGESRGRTCLIYKKNNLLHRTNGPAFDTGYENNNYDGSAWFYMNKNVDMSKITIFCEDKNTIIYGFDYSDIFGIHLDRKGVICVNFEKEVKIEHDVMIDIDAFINYNEQFEKNLRLNGYEYAWDNPEYTFIYNSLINNGNDGSVNIRSYEGDNYFYFVHKRFNKLFDYISKLNRDIIRDKNIWSSLNISQQCDLDKEYSGPLYFIKFSQFQYGSCGDSPNHIDMYCNIFEWVDNGIVSQIDKTRASIRQTHDHLWICGLNIITNDSGKSHYCVIKIDKNESRNVYIFPKFVKYHYYHERASDFLKSELQKLAPSEVENIETLSKLIENKSWFF
jgi:hypothetical protein